MSHAGISQLVAPASFMVAGTMITRTIVESINTPIARPIPISLIVTTRAVANDPKVPIRISPAAVITPAVC